MESPRPFKSPSVGQNVLPDLRDSLARRSSTPFLANRLMAGGIVGRRGATTEEQISETGADRDGDHDPAVVGHEDEPSSRACLLVCYLRIAKSHQIRTGKILT